MYGDETLQLHNNGGELIDLTDAIRLFSVVKLLYLIEMEESGSEIMTYYGRCKCCLDHGYMKGMWTEHYWEGEVEIYGEMLMETFGISVRLIIFLNIL